MKKSMIGKSALRKQGFSLVELLVVVGIIVILMGFIIAMVGAGKRAADSAKCSKVISQLSAAWYLYTGDHDQLMAWSGERDSNQFSDWVWGGQNMRDMQNPSRWSSPGFGFHPEAGVLFPYVTGNPRKFQREGGRNYNGNRYLPPGVPDPDFLDDEFREYRCPNSGEYELLARAQRVNYSINTYIDAKRTDRMYTDSLTGERRLLYEEYLTNVRRPSAKLLFVDEDPRSMRNSSIHPGGSADGNNGEFDGSDMFLTHADKANLSFIDGHVERWTQKKILDVQRPTGIEPGSGRRVNFHQQYWYPNAPNYTLR